MNRTQLYCVARHTFGLKIEESSPLWESLDNYTPFATGDEKDLIFTLTVEQESDAFDTQSLVSLGRFDSDGSCMELFTTEDGGRLFRLFPQGVEAIGESHLYISADYCEAKLTFHHITDTAHHLFGLTNALMLLYAFTTATRDTLLMHASVVENDGKAYMFLGRSGTGKSTHSRLWLQYIAGSRLLNDDNPVIRISPDGTPVIYGTPWSGKTACYINAAAPLGAIVRLSQAPRNEITKLQGVKAYAAISPSLSAMRWEQAMADGIHATLTRLVNASSIYHLQCLPDEAAAHLCAESIQKEELCDN